MIRLQTGLGVRAVYLLVFIYLGAQGNYLPLWLKSSGWTESQTGLVFSLRYVTIIIVPILWGAFSDRYGATAALRIISLGAAFFFIPLLFTSDVLIVTAALTIFAMFRVGIVAVADSLTLTHIEKYGGNFGQYRQWGSFGFIAGGFLLGAATYVFGGREAIPVALWVILLATIGLAFCLPRTRQTQANVPSAQKQWAEMRLLLRNSWMLRFLAVVLLWRLSSQGLYTMLPLHLERIGVPDTLLPVYWAVGVASEILMFRMAPTWFEPLGKKTVLTLCFAACIVQYALLAIIEDRLGVAAIMLFHGLSFGMAYYTCVTWLGSTVRTEIRAAGQGLFQVVAFGFGGAASTVGAGLLFEYGQGPVLFSVAAIVASLTLLSSSLLLRSEDGWSWTGKERA